MTTTVTTTEALGLGIFAINTLLHPDASSDADVALLDLRGPEAVEILDRVRDQAAKAARANLPTDADGWINTDAGFGEDWYVQIDYNTDFDGRWIDPEVEDYPQTFHGPFTSLDEAAAWMEDYPEDTDVNDMRATVLNRVRPRPEPSQDDLEELGSAQDTSPIQSFGPEGPQ